MGITQSLKIEAEELHLIYKILIQREEASDMVVLQILLLHEASSRQALHLKQSL